MNQAVITDTLTIGGKRTRRLHRSHRLTEQELQTLRSDVRTMELIAARDDAHHRVLFPPPKFSCDESYQRKASEIHERAVWALAEHVEATIGRDVVGLTLCQEPDHG